MGRQVLGVMMLGALLSSGAAARAADPGAPAKPAPSAKPAAPAKATPPPIDLNSASLAQLKTLPGIGDKEAKKIVAGRPWSTKVDLVANGVIPEGVYTAIRHRIEVLHPAMPPAAAKQKKP